MSRFIVSLLAALLPLSLLPACVQKMGTEGRLRPYEGAARKIPEGTVSQATLISSPLQPRMSLALLERGRERYNIYCTPCHGPSGYGNGMIVQRGFLAPPSYHQDRLREASDQHFYDVITNGFGAMYSYADRVAPKDRWAITAYIRALQTSQNMPARELSKDEKIKAGQETP